MEIYDQLIDIGWLAFIVYWGLSALSSKKYARRNSWSAWMRVLILAVIALAFTSQPFHQYIAYETVAISPVVKMIGFILFLIGMGLAVWARVYLGRNWGMPMTLKENPELVTSGPYEYVRHPIYSGIILAVFGSALAVSLYWLIPFIVFFGYFIYSAKTEERIMREQFPQQYPEYMKRTKMLIPFVL